MKREIDTKFYMFDQNNSGGSFRVDDKVCHRVIIEAINFNNALEVAEDLGIYFNGCSNGRDCSCCGDRWSDYEQEITNDMIHNYRISTYKGDESGFISKYKQYKIVGEITKSNYGGCDGHIDFENIENYVQNLVNEFAWTVPDARIFYIDGAIKEI